MKASRLTSFTSYAITICMLFQAQVYASSIRLPTDTRVYVKTKQELIAKGDRVQQGQLVRSEVWRDVVINGHVLISAGTPVIAYGRGAINETMIPLGQKDETPTAVFFYEQTAESLIEAVKMFETCKFKSDDLVSHASKWSIAPFKKKIREYVESTIRTL